MKTFKSIFFIINLLCVNYIYSDPINEDIKSHKERFIKSISQDSFKITNAYYQYPRVISTIECPDADYIPKVVNAGEIISDENGEYQVMHNGIKIYKDCYYCSATNWMTDIIYALRGHHEPQEEKVFYEVLKYISPGSTMIELGSYWAYYSLWFANSVKNAKNYMIEPKYEYLLTGMRNFELNNKEGTFVHGYIGNKYDSDIKHEVNIPRIHIDQFLASNNINHVHILHADIQSAEFDMLQTCKKSISESKIDFFFISTHTDLLHRKCLKFLKDHGFHIIAEHTPAQSCSCDGLIAAKRSGLKGPDNVPITKL